MVAKINEQQKTKAERKLKAAKSRINKVQDEKNGHTDNSTSSKNSN
jgi:predicted translin family RNA/ssDNA-binding protein